MNRNTSTLLSLVAVFAMGCDQDGDGTSDEYDCAPDNADIHPGAEEVCDGIDNNCDGSVDDGMLLYFYGDADADGFGNHGLRIEACEAPEGYLADNTDCDDTDAAVYPGASEVCDDIDNDCDNLVDDSDPDVDLSTAGTFYADHDGDTYGAGPGVESCSTPVGFVDNADDCDDASSAITPETVWYGDLDADGFGSDVYTQASCEQPDGYARVGGDCDDLEAEVNPKAQEYCDEVDNNCDGEVDEAAALDSSTWYQDDDGDEWGTSATVIACWEPDGYAAVDGDCDDTDAATNPGQTEVCDGVDRDCDGTVDYEYSVPTDFQTIQAAIDAVDDGETFCVEPGTYYANLYVWHDVGIVGSGNGSTILDGSGYQVIYADSDLTLAELDIENGYSGDGGALYSDGGEVTVRNVDFSDVGCYENYCDGGVIYADGGSLALDSVSFDGVFTDAYYYTYGGLIYGDDSQLTLTDVSVANSSFGSYYYEVYGGLVYLDGGSLTGSDISVADNSIASGYYLYGGLLYGGGEVDIDGLVAEDNAFTALGTTSSSSDVYGGLWYQWDGNTRLTNSSFSGNVVAANDDVWSVFQLEYEGDFALENVLFVDNIVETASTTSNNYSYGLFYLYFTTVSLTNVDVANTEWQGFDRVYGLLGYRSYEADLLVTNSNVVDNTAGAATTYAGLLFSKYANDDGYGEFSFDYSNDYGNWTTWDYGYNWYDGGYDGDFTAFDGVMSADPLYTDAANGDYTLGSGSPAIDAGSPDLLDTDGTVSDIGAYGGPGATL